MKRPAVQCPQFVVDVNVLDGRDLDCVRSRKVKSSSTAGRPTNLQKLNLRICTQITDAVLHLKGLTGLQTLSLNHTKVTDAGVAEVQDQHSPTPAERGRGAWFGPGGLGWGDWWLRF